MAENLRDVIARMKADPKSVQQDPKPAPAQVPQETEVKEVPEQQKEEKVEEMPEKKEIVAPKPSNEVTEASDKTDQQDQQQNVARELMMLQDNGIYRQQLLHQLQEIKKALIVIAQVLVDLSGDGTEKK